MADLKRHTLWTELDEFGVILSLPRHPDEDDHEYIRRLKQRMEWKPGTTPQGLINALSVEFGLTPYYKNDKQIFQLTHKPENLDASVANSSDYLGNAIVNGKLDYGTLRVFVDDAINVNGNPLVEYGEYSPATAPSGWLYPSGYTPNESGFVNYGNPGYIIWRDDEGSYTEILEFLNWVPPTDSEVRVEYVYEDEGGDHQYFSDYSHPENKQDKRFIGISGHVPDPTVDIRILTTDDLTLDGASIGRRELAQRLRSLYGTTWDTFKWGDYTWENAQLAGSGSIPSIYDAEQNAQYSEYIGGVGTTEDLLINDEFSILETVWRPQIKSGSFFLGNVPYHLYEDRRSRTFEAGNSTIDISGAHFGSPITVTELTGLPTLPSGLIDHSTRMYGFHPSGNQTTASWKQLPNLSNLGGIDEFTWNPASQEYWLSVPDWDAIPISGTSPTVPIRINSPSGLGTNLNVYYEADTASGVGTIINEIDVNPTNSYRYSNKFLVIDDELDASPSGYLTIYPRSNETVAQNEIIRIGGHLLGPNGNAVSDALVTIDVSGAQGHPVDVDGGWEDYSKYISDDGTFRFDYKIQDITETDPINIKVTSTKAISNSNYVDVNHPSGT